jgi:hypothetical protein
MLTAQAQVQTPKPGRYLAQFCRHASQMDGGPGHGLGGHSGHSGQGTRPEMRHVEWSDTDGSLILNWGQCTLRAAPGVLTVRAEAADEENLARIQDLVSARLQRFGRRDHLTVAWNRTQSPGTAE